MDIIQTHLNQQFQQIGGPSKVAASTLYSLLKWEVY
jgi:hypothetical protein